MEFLVKHFADYGPLGLTIIMLLMGIAWMANFMKSIHKDHREERGKWEQNIDKRHSEQIDVQQKNTEALTDLHSVISEIKGKIS